MQQPSEVKLLLNDFRVTDYFVLVSVWAPYERPACVRSSYPAFGIHIHRVDGSQDDRSRSIGWQPCCVWRQCVVRDQPYVRSICFGPHMVRRSSSTVLNYVVSVLQLSHWTSGMLYPDAPSDFGDSASGCWPLPFPPSLDMIR